MPVFREIRGKYLVGGEIFVPAFSNFNRPERIVTLLGTYLSSPQLLEAHGILRHVQQYGLSAQNVYTAEDIQVFREAVRWTRWILALNQGRKWAKTRIAERLLPMLKEDIAIVVVPSHSPFITEPPIRLLAKELSSTGNRIDATSCLVRHTKINRIVYGGDSNRELHFATIRLENPEQIKAKHVLLLDDIARTGQSLIACREMLLAMGANSVQAAALGRVRG